nr:hypothetical protein CFP56_57477 [Quercus suber]
MFLSFSWTIHKEASFSSLYISKPILSVRQLIHKEAFLVRVRKQAWQSSVLGLVTSSASLRQYGISVYDNTVCPQTLASDFILPFKLATPTKQNELRVGLVTSSTSIKPILSVRLHLERKQKQKTNELA